MENEYLATLHAVIAYLKIPPHKRDEAMSEGLVSLTKSLQSYKPEVGTTKIVWVWMNARWDLLDWQRKNFLDHISIEEQELQFESDWGNPEKYAEFCEMVDAAYRILDGRERTALLGRAIGYTMSEISSELQLNGQQVSHLCECARLKLHAAMGI